MLAGRAERGAAAPRRALVGGTGRDPTATARAETCPAPPVNYVTDTQALILFARGELGRASRRALRIFHRAEAGRDQVHVPSLCFFELALLIERGRVRSALDFDEWHERLASQRGFPIEPLVWQDVQEARGLRALVDPFDRLIAGTAARLEAPLLTGDERIQRSGLVPTVW